LVLPVKIKQLFNLGLKLKKKGEKIRKEDFSKRKEVLVDSNTYS